MAEHNNFTQLFRYDLWANTRIKDALDGQLFDQSKRCLNLFAHIRAAQQVWYQRINGQSSNDIELWPENTYADENLAMLQKIHEQWLALIKSNSGDLNRSITYQNSKGTTFDTPLHGILQHIIIHGQHHRAQIAALLRQGGLPPPPTDYIYYLRAMNND